MKTAFGEDVALAFLRVLGTSMARLAEAGGTMFRVAQPDIHMTHTRDELTMAQGYRALAEVRQRFNVLICEGSRRPCRVAAST